MINQPEKSGRDSNLGLVSWALYDWANSAYFTLVQTFLFAAYFIRQVAADEKTGTTQWGNTLSVAGLVVAVAGPILGAILDQSGRRKPWIAGFTLLCAVATALLWFVEPSRNSIPLALLLVALGSVGIELATVLYNAMLPDISRPERIGRWSGWGWGLGYAGGLACLALVFLLFFRSNSGSLQSAGDAAHPTRASFLLVGGWVLFFSAPLFFFTPDSKRTEKSWRQAAHDGLQQLWDSMRQVRRSIPILRFMIAWMCYANGLATVFVFGGIFSAGTFKMNEQQVLIFGIALNVIAGLGATSFGWLDDKLGGKRTIIISLIGLNVAGVLMLLARSVTMFWVFGLLLGVFIGPAQAASRSYVARIAPESLRNQTFGFYALAGKATAFLGPLLVGWITYATSSQRLGMGVIILFFVAGLAIMFTAPGDKKAGFPRNKESPNAK